MRGHLFRFFCLFRYVKPTQFFKRIFEIPVVSRILGGELKNSFPAETASWFLIIFMLKYRCHVSKRKKYWIRSIDRMENLNRAESSLWKSDFFSQQVPSRASAIASCLLTEKVWCAHLRNTLKKFFSTLPPTSLSHFPRFFRLRFFAFTYICMRVYFASRQRTESEHRFRRILGVLVRGHWEARPGLPLFALLLRSLLARTQLRGVSYRRVRLRPSSSLTPSLSLLSPSKTLSWWIPSARTFLEKPLSAPSPRLIFIYSYSHINGFVCVYMPERLCDREISYADDNSTRESSAPALSSRLPHSHE